MPKHGNILRLMSFIVTVAIFFIFPPTQIYAGENVNWKTFNEKMVFLLLNTLRIGSQVKSMSLQN